MPTTKKSRKGRRVVHRRKVSRVHESQDQLHPPVTVDSLPDDVLLDIFDFYLVALYRQHDAWHTLVHVCKLWRFVVFASPHRLQLQLLCTDKRPVQNTLDIWPELPIVIRGHIESLRPDPQDVDNIIAALKQHNRVCKIDIYVPNALLNEIREMEMRDPFPSLTSLHLHGGTTIPDSFLGGSAPRLQTLTLDGIPFPALPKLLLSTHDLVELRLRSILPSGYISPEAMVTSLSALSRLKSLLLEFRSPRSRADRENRLSPRMTRIVVPGLTGFVFKGDSEYLEDIVSQIDTPLIYVLHITFFSQLIFDTPQLSHFISRTEAFKAPHRADVCFYDETSLAVYHEEVEVRLFRQHETEHPQIFFLVMKCKSLDRQLSSLVQFCNSALSPLTTLEHLKVYDCREHWEDGAENRLWVELLRTFTFVKDLDLPEKLIQIIAPTLEELAGESVTEVLPAIQNLFLRGPHPSDPVKKAILKFVAARQLSGRPAAVHHWKGEGWQQMHWEVGD